MSGLIFLVVVVALVACYRAGRAGGAPQPYVRRYQPPDFELQAMESAERLLEASEQARAEMFALADEYLDAAWRSADDPTP
jgi:hypothetical protein